jgi:hypothetical protein
MRRQIAFPPLETRFIRLTFRDASLRDVVEVNDIQFVKPCQERLFPLERNVALCKGVITPQGQEALWLTDGLLCEGPSQNQTIGETVVLDLENLRDLFGIAAWRIQTQDSQTLRIEVSADNAQWTDLGSPVFAQGQKGLMLPLSGVSGRYVRFSTTGTLNGLTETEVYAAPESSSQTGG